MLAIGMAAQMFGVCIKTVRHWDKQSKIKSFRTIGNHRRFTIQEIKRVLTRSNEKESMSVDSSLKRYALYGRVSSHKQKKRGDLDGQINALEHYCREKNYIISHIYKDIGSGLNTKRKGFWSLIRDAKKGKFSTVVINFKDRLTRFGFRYVEEYLGEFNVKIIALNKLEEKAIPSIQRKV